MKIFSTLLILLFFSSLVFSQSKVKIGMTLDEVSRIYPNMKMDNYENTITLERPENIYGLDGDWGYRFEDNKLDWIYFHKYIDELNDSNFKKCFNAAKQLIKDYSQFYGNPDTLSTGDTTYIDPYKNHHWGYNVLDAQWKNCDGMKIKIQFTFMGGKGDYHFLFSVNYFDKYYSYYE